MRPFSIQQAIDYSAKHFNTLLQSQEFTVQQAAAKVLDDYEKVMRRDVDIRIAIYTTVMLLGKEHGVEFYRIENEIKRLREINKEILPNQYTTDRSVNMAVR